MTINPDILRLTNIGDNPCLWGIKFVYCNMGIQPKKTSIKDTLIQERKGEHIRNKNRKERENREMVIAEEETRAFLFKEAELKKEAREMSVMTLEEGYTRQHIQYVENKRATIQSKECFLKMLVKWQLKLKFCLQS